jgi:hypothetical protein
MPEAIYPPEFVPALIEALNEGVPKVAQRFLKVRVRELAVDRLRLTEAASRFLARYRDLLLQHYLIQNVQQAFSNIKWSEFLHGPRSPEALRNVPIAGMLGLPPNVQNSVPRVIENIKIGSPFINLVFIETRRGIIGRLHFNFRDFVRSPEASFNWRGPVNWVFLLEYGVSVGTHSYLGFLDGILSSRSGGGIMGKGGHFAFPPTYIFRDIFEEALITLTPEESKLLRVRFVR